MEGRRNRSGRRTDAHPGDGKGLDGVIGEGAEEEKEGQRGPQTEPVGPGSLPGCLLQVDERAGPKTSPRMGLGDREFRPLPLL